MLPHSDFLALSSPHPRRRPFVNRQREINIVAGKLAPRLECNDMSMTVVCIWGTFGIGKSWLLGEIEQEYLQSVKDSVTPTGTTCPALPVRLDLRHTGRPGLWNGDELDCISVVRELWRKAALQRGEHEQEERLAITNQEELARRFVNYITRLTEHATPMLLLDSIDDVVTYDEASFYWIEEHIVEPLALTNRVLLVFASRGELRRWKRFQVRRRVDPFQLRAFSSEEAGEEVKASREIAQVIYRHAFGHPLTTEFFGRVLEEKGIDCSQVSLATAEMAERMLDEKTVCAVLGAVKAQIVERIDQETAAWAESVVVLRWVNVGPLRSVAEALGLAASDEPDAFYLERMGDFQANQLLYWDIDSASYQFDKALRRALAHSLELEMSDRYRAAHTAAYSYHRTHLEEFPQYLVRYVPEVLFHWSALSGQGLPEGVPAFSEWWSGFCSKQAPSDAQPWEELKAAIKMDDELDAVPEGDLQLVKLAIRDHDLTAATQVGV